MSEHTDRVAVVRAALAERSLDGILVTHPTNRRYLTGFSADDIPPNESAGHLLISADDAVLLTGSVNVTQAGAQAPHVRVVKREKSWPREDAALIRDLEIHRLGYEPDAMLEGIFRRINESLVEDGYRLEWSDAGDLVSTMRLVKTPHEIELLRRAFEITCAAFNEVAPTIEVGETEAEVAWRMKTAMVARGAEGEAFPMIVASGPNAARPHHEPGNRRIQEGEPIVIDMGARYEGYCADLTRTVWVGEPDDRLREIYGIVSRAVDEVLERAHPGMTGKDLDTLAREYIESRGYGDEFSHGLGHGVGLRVHEGPSASKNSKDQMTQGNTLTIEPGIYLEQWGGVRVEDVVIFTDSGYEILTGDARKLQG